MSRTSIVMLHEGGGLQKCVLGQESLSRWTARGCRCSRPRPGIEDQAELFGSNIAFPVNKLVDKRLALLAEVTPAGAPIGMLVDPNNPNSAANGGFALGAAQASGKTARALGLKLPTMLFAAANDVIRQTRQEVSPRPSCSAGCRGRFVSRAIDHVRKSGAASRSAN